MNRFANFLERLETIFGIYEQVVLGRVDLYLDIRTSYSTLLRKYDGALTTLKFNRSWLMRDKGVVFPQFLDKLFQFHFFHRSVRLSVLERSTTFPSAHPSIVHLAAVFKGWPKTPISNLILNNWTQLRVQLGTCPPISG